MEQYIISIFLIIIGGVATFMGIKLMRFRIRLSNWKETSGKILHKRVDEKEILPGADLDNFRIYLSYEYQVNGNNFIGNRYNAIELLGGETASLKRIANKEIEKLPEEITVYYDPQKPSDSFVNPISFFSLFISLFIGIPFLLAGIIMLFN